MLDVTALLEKIKASPYDEQVIVTPHTGVVTFGGMEPGARVQGPTGTWKELPGTRLATIEREQNVKPILASQKGEVANVRKELEGRFVEAGTPLMTLRHYLSKDEVQAMILKEALYLFSAPERAKYYFIAEVDGKVKASGPEAVTVHGGMDLFIMSRMKRETTLPYVGPDGVIYATYFHPGDNVDEGAPLVGVCPPDQLAVIQDVVVRVQTEWVEKD
ncbi:MAG: biotin attachment protein [Desulfovibrionaceae bacterium]